MTVDEIKTVIDMIHADKIYMLKVVKNLTFKDTLLGLMSYLLYHGKYTDSDYHFKAFNIETMTIHEYNVEHLEARDVDEMWNLVRPHDIKI